MKSSLGISVMLVIIAQSHEVFGCEASKECFSQVCSSNPCNQIRGLDPWGSGAFGASRGRRTHKGIDIVCSAGSNISAPFPAKVLRRSNPYWNNNADYNTGIYMLGTGKWAGYRVKMWYVGMQVRNGAILPAGSFIGDMKDRATGSRVFGCEIAKKCFSQVCSNNPSNQIRGLDRWGSGAFGASRGRRTHKGIDIVCSAGSNISAPFPAKVLRRSKPYLNNNADYNNGIYMEGTEKWAGYRVKMWYVGKQVRNGAILPAGSYIGDMKDRAAGSRGMTNHVHVQLYKDGKIVDPTPYACEVH
ncbi:myeloid protein 1-like isoform X2 [Oculina patagonica]